MPKENFHFTFESAEFQFENWTLALEVTSINYDFEFVRGDAFFVIGDWELAATAGVNTECRRKSVFAFAPGAFLLPCINNYISAEDRAAIVWTYIGLVAETFFVDGGVHNNTSGAPLLDVILASFFVSSNQHPHTSEEVLLTEIFVFQGEDSVHNNTSAEVDITNVEYHLTPADSHHKNLSQACTLLLVTAHLTPEDCQHNHTSGEPDLTYGIYFNVESCQHNQTSQPTTLTGIATLEPEDCIHNHTSEFVVVFEVPKACLEIGDEPELCIGIGYD